MQKGKWICINILIFQLIFIVPLLCASHCAKCFISFNPYNNCIITLEKKKRVENFFFLLKQFHSFFHVCFLSKRMLRNMTLPYPEKFVTPIWILPLRHRKVWEGRLLKAGYSRKSEQSPDFLEILRWSPRILLHAIILLIFLGRELCSLEIKSFISFNYSTWFLWCHTFSKNLSCPAFWAEWFLLDLLFCLESSTALNN